MQREEFIRGGHTGVAKAIGVRPATFFGWTQGKYRGMSLQRSQEIADRINISVEELLEWLEARHEYYQEKYEIARRLEQGV